MKKTFVLLTMVISLVCLFAFQSSASIVSEAKPIALNEVATFGFKPGNNEAVYKFTPSKTDYYEITVTNFVEDETYIYIYNESGDEIAFTSDDDFSGECYCAKKLTAGKTYYYVIHCYSSDKVTQANIKLIKHTHDLKTTYINKAEVGYDGYYDQECRKCDYEKRTTIPKAIVTLSSTAFTYNGKTQKPTVAIKDSKGNTFKNGTDYTVTYPTKSVDAKYYNLKVTLKKKNYSGNEIYEYSINQKSIKKLSASLSNTTYAYDGKYKKPTVTISGLKNGTDYSCIYEDNSCVGVATVTVYGKGNYKDSIIKTFKIVPAKIKGFKAEKISSTAVYLTWSNYSEYQGAQIYDVNTKKVLANVDVFDKQYTLKKLKPGTVYKLKIREWYETYNGTKLYGYWSDVIEFATKPISTTFKTVTSPKSNILSASWNKQTSVTGYQIQYSTNSKFTSNTTKTITISKNSQTTTNIAKLSGGKKYCVRIRTYKTVKINGKSTNVYSTWSNAKAVTIKK